MTFELRGSSGFTHFQLKLKKSLCQIQTEVQTEPILNESSRTQTCSIRLISNPKSLPLYWLNITIILCISIVAHFYLVIFTQFSYTKTFISVIYKHIHFKFNYISNFCLRVVGTASKWLHLGQITFLMSYRGRLFVTFTYV